MFKIIGCHTDSPVLKLAPVSKAADRAGFQQLGVQLYGGGLWHTWFDRDLTLAGKIIIKDSATGALSTKYWRCRDPILKVPNLAIHLTDRSGTFEPNKESHTKPVLATSVVDQLFGSTSASGDDTYLCEEKHYRALLTRIGGDLGIDAHSIVDFELNVVDSQPAQLVGLYKEFVSSPRLDNLGSSLVALDAILDASSTPDSAEVSMIMLFDHEEVGSQSAQGADSNMAVEATTRIYEALASQQPAKKGDYFRAIRQSFLVSADMAHGLHPNYQEKHQSQHAPRIHQGIALKTNANQRYMTDIVGATIIRAVASQADPQPVPIQDFMVRNDSACGSTIGPMMAAKAGIKTADIGGPMLGMHSIRETCGVIDLLHYRRLFVSFFKNFGSLPQSLMSE